MTAIIETKRYQMMLFTMSLLKYSIELTILGCNRSSYLFSNYSVSTVELFVKGMRGNPAAYVNSHEKQQLRRADTSHMLCASGTQLTLSS